MRNTSLYRMYDVRLENAREPNRTEVNTRDALLIKRDEWKSVKNEPCEDVCSD